MKQNKLGGFMKQFKKVMGTAVCILIIFSMSACGSFDAAGYTQAVLDHIFQGETEALAEFDTTKDKKELKKQYEEYIEVFAESLTEGLDTNEIMTEKFDALCKEIFRQRNIR